MRKANIVLICVIICTSLGGCMFKGKSRVEQLNEKTSSEQEISDKITEDILAALDDGDANALKELYAEPAIEASPELDEQIKALINFYQGEKVNYNGDANSQTSHKSGKRATIFDGLYQITTTEETYQILYIHKPIDDVNPNEIGLYMVEFTTQEEYDKEVEVNGYYDWKYKNEEVGAYFSYSDVKTDEN